MSISFFCKKVIAKISFIFGGNIFYLEKLNKKSNNQYIRIINYHFSPKNEMGNFEKQIKWFLKYFTPCNMEDFEMFLGGKKTFSEKPGILFTFDDGFLENYEVAVPLLNKYGIKGVYMVSPGLIGAKQHISENGCHDYIGRDELVEMINGGSAIGCHTYDHHRMNKGDTEEVLYKQVVQAKKDLEKALEHEINLFCWCGGEESTYTKEAASMIRRAGYKYSMMTNSAPIFPNSNPFQLDRINVETSWPISLVSFQVSGLMDLKLKKKRERVHQLTEANCEKNY